MRSSTFSSKPAAWFKTKVFSLFSLILFSFLLVGCGGADYDDPNQNPDPRTLKQLNEFTFGSYDIKPAYIDGINFDVDIAVRYDITSYNDNFTNEAPNVTHNGKDYSPKGAVDFRTSTPKTYTISAQDGSTQNYDVTVRRAFVVSDATGLKDAINTVTSDIAAGKPISYITIFVASDIDLVATDNITIPYAWAGRNIRLENNNTGSSYVTVKNLAIQGGSTVDLIRVTVVEPVLSSKDITGFTFFGGDVKSANISATSVDIAIDYYFTTGNGRYTNTEPNVTITGKSYSPTGVVDFQTSTPKTYTVTAQDDTVKNYDVIVRRAIVVSTASELETAISTVTSDITAGKPISYITIFIANDITLTSSITLPPDWAGRNIRLENNNTGSSYVTITNLTTNGTVELIRVTVVPPLSSSKDITGFTFGSGDVKLANISATSVDIAIDYISTNNGYTTNEAPNVTITGVSYSPNATIDFATSTPKTYTVTAQDNTVKNYDVIVRRAFVVSDATGLKNAIGNITSDIAAGKPISYITIFVTQDIELLAADNVVIPSGWASRNIRLENNNPGTSYVTIKNLTIQGGSTVERIRVTVIAPILICTAPSICNPTDFNKSIRDNLNGTFDLDDDIDLSGFPDWEPIGNRTHPFTGILNGNNHTISGLTLRNVNNAASFVGLFGNVSGGKIRDLKVEVVNNSPIYLTRDVGEFENQYFGVLAGYIDNGANLSRITVSSNPTTPIRIIKTGQSNFHVGGVVGFADSTYSGVKTLIERSASSIALDVTNNHNGSLVYITTVGGIAGFNLNTSKIENSYATGNIKTNAIQSAYSGGIVGFNWRGVITNSYALGTIYTNGINRAFAGGIAGKNIGTSEQGEIYSSAALNPRVEAYTSNYSTNPIVLGAHRISYNGTLGNNFALTDIVIINNVQRSASSNVYGNDGLSKTLSELQSAYTWQSGYLGWDFNTIWYWSGTRPLLR